MKWLEFNANIQLSHTKHKTIQKRIVTNKLPFVLDSVYSYMAEYDSDQKTFLENMFESDFEEFFSSGFHFKFTKLEFQFV